MLALYLQCVKHMAKNGTELEAGRIARSVCKRELDRPVKQEWQMQLKRHI